MRRNFLMRTADTRLGCWAACGCLLAVALSGCGQRTVVYHTASTQVAASTGTATAPSGVAADWSGFRGPAGMGATSNQGLPTEWSTESNIKWKTPLPGAGASSPIVQGDHIYLTAYEGYFVPEYEGREEPGAANGSLDNLQRILLAYNRKDGQKLWEQKLPAKLPEEDQIRDHGYAASTPAADGDRVYVFYGKSGVHAYDHEGKHLWEADVGQGTGGWGSSASPVLVDDLVIINASVESGSLVALDRLWTTMKGTNVSSPVVHGGHLYWANDNREEVYCADCESGNVVYQERLNRAGQIYASALLANDRIYYLSRYGKVFVVAANPEFTVLAENDLQDGSVFNSSPCVDGNNLLIRSDKYLYCIGE